MIVVRYKIKFRIWDEGFEFLDVWWLDLGFNFEKKKNMIVIIDVILKIKKIWLLLLMF